MRQRGSSFSALPLAGLALLGGLTLAGCGGHGAAAPPKAPELPVLKAELLTVQPRAFPTIVRAQGSLIADEVTIVGAKVGGRVAEILVDLGDTVPAGTKLASLEQEEFKLQVALAEAQLVQARAALGMKPTDPVEGLTPENSPPVREARAVWNEALARVERLRQIRVKNAVTQDELDTAIGAEGVANARYSAALNGVGEKIALIGVRAAELSVAKQRLTDTVIHAPFDGFVQERHVALGSFVQVGDPLVTLVRAGKLRFRGTMPERYAQRLALGQEVTLSIESLPAPLAVSITRLSPVVDEMSRSLVFEAEVPNQGGTLRTGLFAEAEVVIDPAAQSLVVPSSAVTEFAGAEKVWKVVDGTAKEQIVQTAHRGAGGIEIVGGLKPGDVILKNGAQGRVAKIEPISATPEQPQTAPVSTEPPDSTGGEGGGAEAGSEPTPPLPHTVRRPVER
ncbi:MAG TPA: efflux RND transporter periplasmic adaptor subunit [Pirellulaceae bacterium]|nr:efflux RND transporter periplasmic adaptor subunit [Pirellulaceae bacterium]